MKRKLPVFIISGPRGSGKTTLALAVVEIAMKKGIGINGICCPGTWNGGKRSSYSLTALQKGTSLPLAFPYPCAGYQHLLKWWFNPDAIALGQQTLRDVDDCQIIVIDELGMLDIEGHLWAENMQNLVDEVRIPMLLTVRDKFVSPVVQKWKLGNIHIIPTGTHLPDEIATYIEERI